MIVILSFFPSLSLRLVYTLSTRLRRFALNGARMTGLEEQKSSTGWPRVFALFHTECCRSTKS